MESSLKHHLLFLTFFTILLTRAQASDSSLKISADTLDLWQNEVSYYDEQLDKAGTNEIGIDGASSSNRRSLLWGRGGVFHYYISYGALSANRVPCPPRSGRSYYTHNCYKASGPVHPYTRGCSAITRCRR